MTRPLGHRLGPWIALGWILLCGHIAWAHGNGADPGEADAAPARTAPYDLLRSSVGPVRIRNAMNWKRAHAPGAR